MPQIALTNTTMRFSGLFLPFVAIVLGLIQVVAALQVVEPVTRIVRDSDDHRDFGQGE